jgi:hypothetical protein
LGRICRAVQRANTLLKTWLYSGSERQALGISHALRGLAHLLNGYRRLIHCGLCSGKLATRIRTAQQVC